MTSGLISVVIPTYKRPAFLGRALTSVQRQTHPRWEAIVVDDNDPDSPGRAETEAFMERYADDGRIRYLRHERNQGGAAARNTGVREARGEFVAFLDDDDEWLPEKLERQLALFAPERASLVVYCGHAKLGPSGEVTEEVLPLWRGHVLERLLAENRIGTTSTILCRREDVLRAGGFDARLPASQDYDLYVRLAAFCEFDFVPAPLVRFHWHDADRISTNVRAKERAFALFRDKHRALYARYPDAYARHLVFFGRYFVSVGAAATARPILAEAARLRPFDPKLRLYQALAWLEPEALRRLLEWRRRLRSST